MTKKAKTTIQLASLALLAGLTIWILADNATAPYQKTEGRIFGTYFHITYQSSNNYDSEILKGLDTIDTTLSIFNQQSIVSRVNRNEDVKVNQMFKDIFSLAQDVSQQTDGAFDVTVAPLVNLWGFGFANRANITQSEVDSIIKFVGYKTIALKDNKVKKDFPETMLDFGAIAKGYACDVVTSILERHSVSNYIIEIGGEVRAKGQNSQNKPWTIGIEKPQDDSLRQNPELMFVLNVKDMAVATSGNYRNYYYKDGHKYSHTISPHTGFPVQHSLLSATVCAPNCAMADAYATAFMVMGLDKAKQILNNNTNLSALFIYSDKDGNYHTWSSPKMEKYLSK